MEWRIRDVVCVFVLIASEFMPISLLTPVASDLAISEGQAGQAIAMSGVGAVLTSLLISTVAAQRDRKSVLLWMTALIAVSGALIGMAPNFGVYMAGRVLIGIAIGGFWSMSAASAMRLVPAPQVPRALAIFNGGNALATVIAAPVGNYLGSIIGWRGTFLCLVPVALIALMWQMASLPSMRDTPAHHGQSVFTLLTRPVVVYGMAGAGLFFMGQFALFTYLRPFLETVTGIGRGTLSLLLLVVGVSGVAGTTVIGRFVSSGLYRTLIAIPALMALVAVALIVWGDQLTPTSFLLGAWGFLATAAPVAWWSWVARTLPDEAEAAGGLMVAVIQFAIAMGSSAGGALFDAMGYGSTFAASAILLLASSALTALTGRTVTQRASQLVDCGGGNQVRRFLRHGDDGGVDVSHRAIRQH